MPWIDSHCHLDFLTDPPGDMARAEASDIGHWLLPGIEPHQWHRIRQRFQSDRRVRLSFGYHPWYLPNHPPELRSLEQTLDDCTDAVAIGEIGLDFYRGKPQRPPADHQEAWFESQLKLASERALPLIVHAVKAHDRVLHFLKRYPEVTGVIHAFSGPYEQAMAYVDKGWSLGCGSLILKSGKTLDAFGRLPLDNLLMETDAPDMRPKNPISHNSLLDLLQVSRRLAEERRIELGTLRDQTTANARRLFGF